MRPKRVLLAVNALLVAILACNLPGGQGTPTPTPTAGADLAATITAQALTLQVATATAAPPSETPTITPTSTPSVPQVSVSSATNCRTGPSTAFDWLYGLDPGKTAEVVGKNTPSGYWIIKYPGGTCWLWGQYATVSGDTSGLTEYPMPATPTPSKPAAPTDFQATAACSPIPATLTFSVHVTLAWADAATNEEGYRIFRNDALLATLGPNATSFADDTTLPVAPAVFPPVPGPSIKYGIQAFNGAGASATKEKSINCD